MISRSKKFRLAILALAAIGAMNLSEGHACHGLRANSVSIVFPPGIEFDAVKWRKEYGTSRSRSNPTISVRLSGDHVGEASLPVLSFRHRELPLKPDANTWSRVLSDELKILVQQGIIKEMSQGDIEAIAGAALIPDSLIYFTPRLCGWNPLPHWKAAGSNCRVTRLERNCPKVECFKC